MFLEGVEDAVDALGCCGELLLEIFVLGVDLFQHPADCVRNVRDHRAREEIIKLFVVG